MHEGKCVHQNDAAQPTKIIASRPQHNSQTSVQHAFLAIHTAAAPQASCTVPVTLQKLPTNCRSATDRENEK